MRAVIYCRVSTEEEIQVNALKNQVSEAIEAVKRQQWILVDQYIDEGKSGTAIYQRKEYKRLLKDMLEDKFDVIVIKSQDRLMRNTKDWYLFVDQLVKEKKKLFFYLYQEFYTPDDALITGIRAILAEEYSRDLSKKINHAHQNRQKKGTNVVITSNTWGYDKQNKKVVVNDEEAEVVRYIYELCCQGFGSRVIAKKLEEKGIKSRSGGKFPEITICRILRNPMYMGTVIMNKTHYDFNCKRRINNKEEEWIYHEGMIPAIISKEVWELANVMMDKRVNEEKEKKGLRGKNIGKHPLSGKIICGECNANYWLRKHKNTNGEKVEEWSCSEYVKRGRKTLSNRSVSKERVGGCDNIHIKEKDLEDILCQIGQKILSENERKRMQSALMKVIENVVSGESKDDRDSFLKKQDLIRRKRERLLDKLLEGVISDELFRDKNRVLNEEYDKIAIELERNYMTDKTKEIKLKRFEELMNEIVCISDETLVLSRMYEHITNIFIYPTYGIVNLDCWEKVRFNRQRRNYKNVKYWL